MQILENISLKPFNTFGINLKAKYVTTVHSPDDLLEALAFSQAKSTPYLVLGGGSNVLFTKNFDGLVILNRLKGIEKVSEDEGNIFIKVQAGEVWHEFVLFCLDNNYAGVENLALIPGCTGASPMQNIGAYGVEIKEVFHELTALDTFGMQTQTFSKSDCEFGYRESVFKNKYRGRFIITDVTYRLNKKPSFQIEYGAIRQELEKRGIQDLSIRAVAEAVIAIRSSKLPDPAILGNAGSFFKNPSIQKEAFLKLKERFPAMVAYENPDATMKLAAGWMIEQCGFKGFRRGDAGVHDKQALVLVNYDEATGPQIVSLCKEIQNAVLQKFGVELQPEVNFV